MNPAHKRILFKIHRNFPNVTTIVDATEPVVVEVTSDDQKKSTVLDEAHCALATACVRQYRLSGAMIGMSRAYLIKGNVAFRYKTSQTVAREIVSFDRHGDFAAGVYRLSPTAPTARLGARPHRGGKTGSRTGVQRGHHFTARVRDRL